MSDQVGVERLRQFELDKCYVDRGGSSYPDDEFLRWINIDKSGMRNSPGIRPLNYVHRISKERLPAYLILVTHDKSSSAALNPWEDIVDLLNAQILYWGDSKVHESKRLDDFKGMPRLGGSTTTCLKAAGRPFPRSFTSPSPRLAS